MIDFSIAYNDKLMLELPYFKTIIFADMQNILNNYISTELTIEEFQHPYFSNKVKEIKSIIQTYITIKISSL